MALMNVSILITLKFQITWLVLQMYIVLPVDTDKVKQLEQMIDNEVETVFHDD